MDASVNFFAKKNIFCKIPQILLHKIRSNFKFLPPKSHFYYIKNNQTNYTINNFIFSEGPFQSDALLVPEGCLFDHIHNASRCWPFVRWNQTGAAACQDRGMQMRSFAMLLPCGISLFSGVEFVCCPKHFKGMFKYFYFVIVPYYSDFIQFKPKNKILFRVYQLQSLKDFYTLVHFPITLENSKTLTMMLNIKTFFLQKNKIEIWRYSRFVYS